MKRSISALISISAFIGLLLSCSSDDGAVKSSENYIEEFEVAGTKGEIRDDQKLVYIWTEAVNYESLKNGEPIIKVSLGASYSKSGDDWAAEGFEYIVTAENGKTNSYSVQIDTTVPRKYSFEVWTQPRGYYIPAGSNSRWTSGNEGISWALQFLGKGNNNPENYPTKKTTEGYSGNAVLMETIVGDMALEKPLFSGNLILGKFNMQVAMVDELAAIEIGRPYPAKPNKITGYYKYKEGPDPFMSYDTVKVPLRNNDSCSMIVSFYQSDLPSGGDTTLTVKNRDNDNSSLIIAEARKQNCSETTGDGFHPFELTLVYNSEPDFENHRYKLGMTFAASKDGDYFSGKIGSKLIVDEIEIIDYE